MEPIFVADFPVSSRWMGSLNACPAIRRRPETGLRAKHRDAAYGADDVIEHRLDTKRGSGLRLL